MSLHLCVVLNNIGGILYDNGHNTESRQMFKTAVKLASFHRHDANNQSEASVVAREQLERKGHDLLQKYKTTPRLHSRRIVVATNKTNGDYYNKVLAIPMELLLSDEIDFLPGKMSCIETLVMAISMFHLAISSLQKHSDQYRHFQQVHELAKQVIHRATTTSTTTTTTASSNNNNNNPVTILSHFLILASLHNQAIDKSDSVTCWARLFHHSVSKSCRMSDWTDFGTLQEDATDFLARAVYQINKKEQDL